MKGARSSESRDLGSFDVCIVGLGVAGSNLAALLSPRLKTIAIDKKRDRGHCFDSGFHKPCGGLLSEGGQKALAKQGINLAGEVLTQPQIFAINTIEYGYPHASYIQKGYVNMERHRFDLWLKSRIGAHVSVWHDTLFSRVEKSEGGYIVYFRRREEDCGEDCEVGCEADSEMRADSEIDSENKLVSESRRKNTPPKAGKWVEYRCFCSYVIGADGAKSHIRRWLYPKLEIPSLVCIQEWFKEQNAPMLSCLFDRQLSPSYSWSMSKEGYFIFGGAYPHKGCQEAFRTQLGRLKELGLAFGAPLKREACLVLQPTRPWHFARGKEGVFLIGEAAGFINASTLEGISGALHSSRILAQILNDFSESKRLETAPNHALNALYTKATRGLMIKTLFRHYVRYPFMFVPFLRRLILRFGILRVRRGLKNGKII